MAIESIALIPSGYKATKVYSQLPVNGNGDFTFDRGTSTAQTRVNKDGLIESVDQDVPRLDYLDGGCPSLLLEPSSTNLITYSDDFSNVAWLKSNVTISANSVLSPDGSVNADKVIPSAVSGVHSVKDNLSTITGDYTQSVFVKKGEYKNVLFWDDTLSSGIGINLDDFSIFREQGTFTYKIVNYGGDWYRVSVTRAYSAQLGAPSFYVYDNSATPQISYSGDGISGIYIWGAQFEQKSYATSYIPTSGATALRAAETCNGAGTTAEINSQEGVLYFEGRALANDGTSRNICLSDGTAANKVEIYYDTNANQIDAVVNLAGVAQAFFNITSTIDITKYQKIALKYKANDFAFYINGLLVDADVSGSTFSSGTLNELAFDKGNGTLPFYGRVKRLSVYNSALNDSELESLTGFGSFAEMKSYLSYS